MLSIGKCYVYFPAYEYNLRQCYCWDGRRFASLLIATPSTGGAYAHTGRHLES